MRIFPYNGFQYCQEEILAWNPKRVTGYTYTKKAINETFEINLQVPISANEFDHAEMEFERLEQELRINIPAI